jgi:sugar phosphate isomerase/epimerase
MKMASSIQLGCSNIAWPPAALSEALPLLKVLDFSIVEIAPFNVFGRWDGIADQARRLREEAERHGLVCGALQGILYNAPDIELFASDASRRRLAKHLAHVATLAGILGAKACVFGAPRQRDPGDLPEASARQIAAEFFRAIGPVFAEHGSAIAFEANATRYGCRFITTTRAAIDFVAEVAAPGFGLQIDTGTVFLEHEPVEVLCDAISLAVHAHVSEPDLQPIGSASLDHRALAGALRDGGYTGSLSIEMRAEPDWRTAVTRAAEFVRMVYQ